MTLSNYRDEFVVSSNESAAGIWTPHELNSHDQLSRIECPETIGKTVLLFALFELSDKPCRQSALSSSHSQPVVCVDLCWAAALSVQTSNNNISLLCPWIISLPPTSLLILYVLTLRWVFPSLAVRSLCYHGNIHRHHLGSQYSSIFLISRLTSPFDGNNRIKMNISCHAPHP